MLFQNIVKPESILRTDFDQFLVSLCELETSSHSEDDPFGISDSYVKIKNYITATIKIHNTDAEIIYSIFKESEYCCEPKYPFSLETKEHTFSNGVIMELNRMDELELKIRFDSFILNETYDTCPPCTA